MSNLPTGHRSVMASRVEAHDSLDYFPTPPWATRALCEHVLPRFCGSVADLRRLVAWEPAAGQGHMAEPLKEYFRRVFASDVHDYGKGYGLGSFVGDGFDKYPHIDRVEWIITNPPFRLALEFAERAIQETGFGVALLLRSVFIESETRYRFFEKHPLTVVAQFAERVPMTKGRWDPKASTATSYAWFIWCKGQAPGRTQLILIPPGQRKALTKPGDIERFGVSGPPEPLYDGGPVPPDVMEAK